MRARVQNLAGGSGTRRAAHQCGWSTAGEQRRMLGDVEKNGVCREAEGTQEWPQVDVLAVGSRKAGPQSLHGGQSLWR